MDATLSPNRLRWPTVVALYAVLTLGYCWPLILSLDSGLPNDTGDPGLLSFLLWWNAHAVPFSERWWNAPMFYPQTGALAFSDTLLGLSPFSTPLIWAGVSAVAVYNILFILSILTAAVAAHALAHRLTGRHDVAIIAGLAFGFSPYRAAQMPHLQLLVTCWMPLGLLFLHRFIRDRHRRDLLFLGLCWLMNGLTNGYYLVFFAVLAGLWMLWFVRERRDWLAIVSTLGLSSLPLVPIIIGHARIQRALGMARGRDEIVAFSADLTGFLAASSHAWLPFQWTLEPKAEGELYPGLALVILAATGAVMAWRRIQRPGPSRLRRWLFGLGLVAFAMAWLSWASGGWKIEIGALVLSLTRPHRIVTVGIWLVACAGLLDRRIADAWQRRSVLGFYVMAAGVMAVLALGPVAHAFGVRFMQQAPYSWLMALPGGDSLRVPARFVMLMILCLSQAAAIAFARLTPSGTRFKVLALVALAVLADGWVPNLLVARTPPSVALPGVDPKAVVLELPIRDLWSETAALIRATQHGRPVVNGFSGYGPPHYNALLEGLAAGDGSVISELLRFAPLVVLINQKEDGEGAHEAFVRRVEGAQLIYRTPVGPVYRFAEREAPEALPDERELPVARIDASANVGNVPAMRDGALETQWKTLGAQTPGDRLSLNFDGAIQVSRVEMDLGDALLDYPRELRVEARLPDGGLSTVWHSGTAGAAMMAAMRDRIRRPMTIALPPGTRTRELVLTITAGDPVYYWTVAELRVFGRLPSGESAGVIGSSSR